eukprot:TRINITY_DN1228_c0_g1_i2.p1 TRINITY_DN1228_c0_g1~~TRINITY_DN1228_c0_g1_i2.p1  ORF type:complete len:776 (+),score=198.46 TRINITY_DN1228_c0_g1_i2:1922-4249(+)
MAEGSAQGKMPKQDFRQSSAIVDEETRPALTKVRSISALKQYYGRIIVVSNRLPVTIQTEKGEGDTPKFTYKMSSGGLVAGLEGVKKKLPFLWVGWTGMMPDTEEQKKEIAETLENDWHCIPVWLEEELADLHYNKFSNGVLWPLFHYLLEESGQNFREEYFTAYVEANRRFAEVIENIWEPGDLIWIHDYHLICLPEILRQRIPKIRCGFFLHIPFPSSEIFQVLPVRKQILTGMLNCDMIGFHTYDYARHFMASCTKMMGLETTLNGVNFEGRFVPVSIFPVGIDVDKFIKQLDDTETQKKIEDYLSHFKGKKIFLGVDRLDYIKGLPHKLKAFERFLQKYPQWQNKVALIQVAVPSRTDVEEYKKLKDEIDQLVGHINGTYGSLNFSPILYLFKSVAFPELTALYRISDAIIITSNRDGMNLVAKEYIACQKDKNGPVILSEFAGSANALSGSILVNPYNIDEVADAMNEALTMNEEDKAYIHSHLFDFISRHNASHWGESFIKDLWTHSRSAERLDNTPKLGINHIESVYRRAHKRLLVFASDGALISTSALPFLAHPSRRVFDILGRLCADERNVVYVVSGRDRATLMGWFGNLPIGLVAEHGYYICDKANTPEGAEWTSLDCDLSWKANIKPIFEQYTESTPGSFLEEKETSLTWHYRSTEVDFGAFRGQELLTHLDVTTFPANVVAGDKTVEVRPHECNATTMLKKLMNRNVDFDAMVYIGDTPNIDFNDDKRVFTCGVGHKNQKYFLNDSEEVVSFLDKMSRLENLN